MTADPIRLELATLTLGPAVRRQAADYGLRTRGLRLSDEAELLLEDLALALAEWGKGHSGSFEALLWLGEKQRQYALLKVVHLGPGAMGPIVVAQGVLLPDGAMAAIGGRAHRLLPAIPAPSLDLWEAATLRIGWDPATRAMAGAPPQPAVPTPDVDRLALGLASSAPPWPAVGIVPGNRGEADRIALLDAIPWRRLSLRPSWLTTSGLPPLGSFAPRRVALMLYAATPGAAAAPGGILVDGGEVRGTAAPAPPALQIFLAIFDEAARLAGGGAANSPAARNALETVSWQPAYANLSTTEVIVASLADMVAKGLSSSDFWDVLAATAAAASRLPEREREAASAAVADFFSKSASRDPAVFARLLAQYIDRIATHFPGEQDKPLLWAIERRVLGRLQAAHVERLVRASAGRLPERKMAEALAEESPQGEGGLPPEVGASLLTELGRIYAQRPLEGESLRLIGAALGATRLPSGSTSPEVRQRLGAALWEQAALLLGERARVLDGWWRYALGFVPRMMLLLSSVGEGRKLASWIGEAHQQICSRPFLDEPGDVASEDFLSLLVVRNAVMQGTPGVGR